MPFLTTVGTRRKSSDLDDYEEETLPTQIRSGELGEMLQEAHLDHRIQLNFDDKNGEDEAFEEGEDEDEATAGAQPSTGEAGGQQRRDRGARTSRRGRGVPGAPDRGNRRGGPRAVRCRLRTCRSSATC